jgi:hypothetical protein
MNIEIKYADRTSLNENALVKTIKKFCKLKRDVYIIFDNRLKLDCGNYQYDEEYKLHTIKLSVKNGRFLKGKQLDEEAEKYNFLITLLHEIRHAQQYEEFKNKFWSDKLCANQQIQEPTLSVEYSKFELDAKAYENANINKVVEFYNKCLTKERK